MTIFILEKSEEKVLDCIYSIEKEWGKGERVLDRIYS